MHAECGSNVPPTRGDGRVSAALPSGRGASAVSFTRAACFETEASLDELDFGGGFIISNFLYKGCIDILKCTLLYLHQQLLC